MTRRRYTLEEDRIITDMYPDTLTELIAKKLNRSERAIYGRAHFLGLHKSKEFIKKIGIQKGSDIGKEYWFRKGQTPANKGKKMPPELYEKMKHTFFQKGHKPHNTKRDGYVSIRRDKRSGKIYKYIRLSESTWGELHRVIWEKVNGPIPEGYNIVFKDGDNTNCKIENLEMISNAELLNRNRLSNWPPELQEVIRMNNKLKKITKNG